MKYQGYYSNPQTRSICHVVKEKDGVEYVTAIKTMANYFSDAVDSSCAILPVPQHSGHAEYTKDIAEVLFEQTGAEVYDIIKCKPHKSLYIQRKELNTICDLDIYIDGDIPNKKLFVLDNVISTGQTFFSIVDRLKRPAIPLVYAIDDTTFTEWKKLRYIIKLASS